MIHFVGSNFVKELNIPWLVSTPMVLLFAITSGAMFVPEIVDAVVRLLQYFGNLKILSLIASLQNLYDCDDLEKEEQDKYLIAQLILPIYFSQGVINWLVLLVLWIFSFAGHFRNNKVKCE